MKRAHKSFGDPAAYIVLLGFALLQMPANAAAQQSAAQADIQQTVVAGSTDDFMEVSHVRIKGTDRQIGKALATLAVNHGWALQESTNPEKTAAQLSYFARYWPQQVERMQGVADFAGENLQNSRFNFAGLFYQEVSGGCSCFYLPPDKTSDGKSLFSRNFDFTTGPFNRQPRTPENPNACSRPLVMEIHPDSGYSTLSIVCFDLFGIIDGINSEGLTIALLADDEIMRENNQASPGARAGFGVLEIPRFILETCATVDEAKQAFYEAKLYYSTIPCHYLVADRHGNSFVWENSAGMNDGVAIDGNGDSQITTNFMLHRHLDEIRQKDLPKESHPLGYFNRYRTIEERIESAGSIDFEQLCDIAGCVAATIPVSDQNRIPGRTLWHSIYVPESRSMKISFYLGEGEDGPRRTGYLEFGLSNSGETAAR